MFVLLLDPRANLQLMAFLVAVASLAAFNALRVPLHLEHQVKMHPMSTAIYTGGVYGH